MGGSSSDSDSDFVAYSGGGGSRSRAASSGHHHGHAESGSDYDLCSEFSSDGCSDGYTGGSRDCKDKKKKKKHHHKHHKKCSNPWKWWVIVFWILVAVFVLALLYWAFVRLSRTDKHVDHCGISSGGSDGTAVELEVTGDEAFPHDAEI